MDFKIIWADSALADLENICSYLSQRNPQAGYKIGRAILDHVAVLARFPLIGPTYPKGARGSLREVPSPPYRIFYDVDESRQGVEISTSGTAREGNLHSSLGQREPTASTERPHPATPPDIERIEA